MEDKVERRAGQEELLVTAKAMTDATTELTSQLKKIGGEVTDASDLAKDRSAKVVKEANVVKIFTVIMFALLVVLILFAFSNRGLQQENHKVLNRINMCLNNITVCASQPSR